MSDNTDKDTKGDPKDKIGVKNELRNYSEQDVLIGSGGLIRNEPLPKPSPSEKDDER